MKMRTRIQENRFGQALGYAWGVKDTSKDMFDLVLDSTGFATFYSVLEDINIGHLNIQDAYNYFKDLPPNEQKEIARIWARRPWSVYEEERNRTNG